MNFKSALRNSFGIGMVEVMMGVAISGGLALTVAKLMENSSQNIKSSEAKSENINLKGIVQNILSNQTACNYTFSPVITQANLTTLSANPENKVTIPAIKDKLNTIKYTTASNNILPLTITSMYMSNYVAAAGTADLVITSTFRKSSSTVQDLKPIKIPLNYNIDNSNPSSPVLVACSVSAVESGSGWELGGNAGTVDGTDFIGTTDNVPLNFRVNSNRAGRITDASTNNTFLGVYSGNSSPTFTGANNVGIGHSALMSNNSGFANVAIGTNAARMTSAVSGTTAVGSNTMWAHTSGDMNTAIGYTAMQMSTTSSQNTAVGAIALRQITTGQNNVAMGYGALNANTTGANNVAVGHSASNMNTTGSSNVAIGDSALAVSTVARRSIAIGHQSLMNYDSTSIWANNISIGFQAMMATTTGSSNTAMGTNALGLNTTGNSNVAVGNGAAYNNTTGMSNTAIGSSALNYITTGSNNIGIGQGAAYGVATGSNNIGIGSNTLNFISDGSHNIGIGERALNGNVGPAVTPAGNENVAIGSAALVNNNGGHYNVAIGRNAGSYNDNGDYNVFIGYRSGGYGMWETTGDRNIFIGPFSGNNIPATDSNKLHINNGVTATSLIEGDFTSSGRYVKIDGKLGIGVVPTERLHVSGNVLVNGNIVATGTITPPSDKRLKENIKPLKNSLENLSKIQGVSYQLKDRKEKDAREMGVIAQDVKKVYPELVTKFTYTDGKEYNAVNYNGFIAPLIEAVKDLYAKILALIDSDAKQDQQIKNLKAENEKLKADLKRQQESEAQMKADLKRQQESFEARMKKLESQIDDKKTK